MAQHHPNPFTPEVTYHAEHAEGTGRIWKTFWLLLIITVIELGLGLLMYAVNMPDVLKVFIKGVIVILSLAKAFYIISIFMHLGDEIRNMIMTIAVPILLFFWFIGAFLWDGNSYKNLQNTFDRYKNERSTTPVQDTKKSEEHSKEGKVH